MKWKKILKRGLRWTRSRFVKRSAILLYHRVAEPVDDRFKLCVSPAHFDEQMAVLSRTGRAMRLTDLVRRTAEGKVPDGAMAVTFDDGYVDNLRAALPILEHYGIPATVFVVTGKFGEHFWWDRLGRILEGCPELPGEVLLQLPGGPLNLKEMDAVYPVFRRLEPEVRDRALDALGGMLGEEETEVGRRSVSLGELRELAEHPLITIGAHTVNHGQLSELSAEGQRREIAGSKEKLEEVLGREVTTFSYPFGLKSRDFTDETMGIAKAAGLECALAADLDVVTQGSERYALPRLWVHNWDGRKFRRAIGRWVNCSPREKDAVNFVPGEEQGGRVLVRGPGA